MSGLLVIGAGGQGKVVADTAYEHGHWKKIAFLDDRYPELNSLLSCPVLGKIEHAPLFSHEYSDIVVAIGNNLVRVKLIRHFKKIGFSIPIVVHPSAFVSKFAKIGSGSVIFAQGVVNAGAEIGIGCIVNTGATVDHDCSIGDGVHVSPGAHLAGEVKIGSYSWIGIGSAVIQQISIGKNVLIGAGTVITKNIPDDVTVVGVPGKIIKKHGIEGGC